MQCLRLVFFILFFAIPSLFAADGDVFSESDFAPALRGGRLLLHVSGEQDVELYADSYALVIGASQYRNGWPRLSGVNEDVTVVAEALRKNGFRVGVVKDPTLEGLERAIGQFINRYGLQPNNRLLFYFAGHGHSLKTPDGRTMGYLVPVDAPAPNENDPHDFIVRAMPMDQIETYAKRIRAKHALFMFDACFAGTIFDALRAAPPARIRYQMTRPVRQFITSGASGEAVPDHSLFRRQFVAALEGEGEATADGYLTGEELGHFLQDSVTDYSNERQHPQYGRIRLPELDKGDFIFEIPNRTVPPVTVGKARLTLNSLPEAQLKINATGLSEFPLFNYELAAGTHRITFISDQGKLEKNITLKPGEKICCTAFFERGAVECRARE